MNKRKPDFENNLLRVLRREKPNRATLYEFGINDSLLPMLAGHERQGDDIISLLRLRIDAMSAAGYDCFVH